MRIIMNSVWPNHHHRHHHDLEVQDYFSPRLQRLVWPTLTWDSPECSLSWFNILWKFKALFGISQIRRVVELYSQDSCVYLCLLWPVSLWIWCDAQLLPYPTHVHMFICAHVCVRAHTHTHTHTLTLSIYEHRRVSPIRLSWREKMKESFSHFGS